MTRARVLDASGQELSPCDPDKALRLVDRGEAELISPHPLVVRLNRIINRPKPPSAPDPLGGKTLLLHICCAPCATYTVRYFRDRGAEVSGHWYNPNIHPFSEHERRRETLAGYAQGIGLPVLDQGEYEMPAFLRTVAGRERFRERCALCYRLRLERTAQVAAREGFELFSTTLLISPYQDLGLIHEIGEQLSQAYRVAFYFENLRRGFAEHSRLARQAGLYQQRYCGCLYSEWEALDRGAGTHQVPGADESTEVGG